jgi:hypothetical protein
MSTDWNPPHESGPWNSSQFIFAEHRRRGNRVRENETGARSFHDALQWLMCT